MIAIIDYGMGNLRSVQKAIEYIGGYAQITYDARVLERADRIILPGVGAFHDAITQLRLSGLADALISAVASGKPILGVCLGMQLLFDTSCEFGQNEGLRVIHGDVVLLDNMSGTLKIPHMGWNQVKSVNGCPILAGIDDADFYFVHSYAVRDVSLPCLAGITTYGQPFASVVQAGNVFGTQFHPEKSGDVGLQLYKNWMEI